MVYGVELSHYALLTYDSDGAPEWGTPVAIPNHKSIDFSPVGDTTKVYADNVAAETITSNQGYEGTLEYLDLPDSLYTDVFGFEETTTGGLVEMSDAVTQPIALLGQLTLTGETGSVRRFVYYNVTLERPGMSSETKEESVEETTTEMSATATTVTINGRPWVRYVRDGSTTDTKDTEFTNWFTSVPEPTLASESDE